MKTAQQQEKLADHYPLSYIFVQGERVDRPKIINNFIEVKLTSKDAFLKIKETLTRMGVGSYKDKVLKQSCHILHKKGRYYVLHYKELLALDGVTTNVTMQDYLRRNQIIISLEEWGLCDIVNGDYLDEIDDEYAHVIVIPHKEKKSWKLYNNYEVGAWIKEAEQEANGNVL